MQEGRVYRLKKEAQQSLPELSIEELASLCVGYGPGTPFAAVGDRSDPATIFDDEGKPITTNSPPDRISGICFSGDCRKRNQVHFL